MIFVGVIPLPPAFMPMNFWFISYATVENVINPDW
jgi:hypothetical protein